MPRLCAKVMAVRMTNDGLSDALIRKSGGRRDPGSGACPAGLQNWLFPVSLDWLVHGTGSHPQDSAYSALFSSFSQGHSVS